MTETAFSRSKETITNARSSTPSTHDITWILGLFGTAIGAGVLFLPINAGIGGLWPLLIMAIIAFPLTFFSHQGLTRFVLSGSGHHADITHVVEEHFGKEAGMYITLLYFFTIYPILLLYSVAVTNTVDSLLLHQLHITPPPRILLAGVLVFLLMAITRYGRDIVVRTMSVLVFPFVIALMGCALYLVPHWNMAFFQQSPYSSIFTTNFFKTLWLAIPVMVFSFNHSAIISSFAVAQKTAYGNDADKKSSRILKISHLLMLITVMLFVFSSVLSLTPADLSAAKQQNISILSYLANTLHNPIFAIVAPVIALVAITKSFLGHYLGASEGLNSLVTKWLRRRGKEIPRKRLNGITTWMMGISAWMVATINPSILGMIETLGGPVIALLLFIMPMYAIRTVPAMRCYAGKASNVFVVFIGSVAISAILYTLFV